MIREEKITRSGLAKRAPMKTMDRYVRELAVQIDASISHSHDELLNSVTYSLPVNFDVTGVSRKDAQLFVYSELLQLYNAAEPEGRGLSARIQFTNSSVNLIVSWPTSSIMSERDKTDRKQIISRYSIQK